MSKRPLLTVFLGFLSIYYFFFWDLYFSGDFLFWEYFPIFEFCSIGAVQNCSRVFFRVLDEKLAKNAAHHTNPKFPVSPFLDLEALDELVLKMLTDRSGWYLEESQTRAMLVY